MNHREWSHTKRVKRYNIPGHIHFLTFTTYRRIPLLGNDSWRSLLAESLRRARAEHEMGLWAYVFMLDHVHLLVKPRQARYNISVFQGQLKQRFTVELLATLEQRNAPLLERLWVRERPGKWCHRVWQEGGGHDLNIYSMDKAIEKMEYCHNNPVRKRLVAVPEAWTWSSYRWLVLGEREGVPVRIDEWDPSFVEEEADGFDRDEWKE